MSQIDLSKLMDYDNTRVNDLDLYKDIINYVNNNNYSVTKDTSDKSMVTEDTPDKSMATEKYEENR